MKRIAKVVLLGAALTAALSQQVSAEYIQMQGYQPMGFETDLQTKSEQVLPRIPVNQSVTLSPLEQERSVLQKKSLEANSNAIGQPLATGFDRAISITANSKGMQSLLQWRTNSAGGQSAALRFVSPDAAGSRIILHVDQLPAAAQVRFISEATDDEFTVTGEEIINTISLDRGTQPRYVGPHMEGESTIIEIHLPAGVDPEKVQLSVPLMTHIYLSEQAIEQHYRNQDLSCMVNAACSAEHDIDSRAVAAINFHSNGYSYVCSGTLLNDTGDTGTPNFITAHHCIGTQAEASTMESRWFYRTTSCYGSTLDSRNQLVRGGADLLFTRQDTDTTLLRLRRNPPNGVLFQGWTIRPVRQQAVSILHHPGYESQKVTRGTARTYAKCDVQSDSDQFRCEWFSNFFRDDNYVLVENTRSVVSGGSSGSGLLVKGDGGDNYYAGTLLGGSSSCSTPSAPDFYGRFDLSFKAGLGEWLVVDDVSAPDTSLSPVHRFYHTTQGTHFFTANSAERDYVAQTFPEYIYEGVVFSAYLDQQENMSPVYRFYNTNTGAHFYTISAAEKNFIIAQYASYIYEGEAWYAAEQARSGTNALYRFYNTATNTHFYTTSVAEKDHVIASYPSYIYEGIAYYTWP